MARQAARAASAYDEEFGQRKTWRLGIWATVAMGAVAAAVATGFVDSSARHAHQEQATRIASTAPAPRSSGFDAELESRRLSEAVRLLAADRDRLMARINALERNLGDVTGSISEGAVPARSAEHPGASTANAPPTATPPASAPPSQAAATAGNPPASALPRPGPQGVAGNGAIHSAELASDRGASPPAVIDSGPTGSVATRTDFGVDLGTSGTVDGLRILWQSVRGPNQALFEGLRPVVSVREGSKPGSVELRLVVGPLTNASGAARLCASLAATGVACQPTVFDGQRLALK
jgi:hypothetical protein